MFCASVTLILSVFFTILFFVFFFCPTGKTSLVLKLLQHESESFSKPFTRKYWCMPEGSEAPESIRNDPNFEVMIGWPDGRSLDAGSLCVVDDLQSDIDKNALLLFTVFCSHRNITTINLNHCFFPKNKFQRVLTQSTRYLVCLNSPRDTQSFMRLAQQLEPHRAKELYRAYLDAVSEEYGFLCCDLTSNVHPSLKYRSFPVSGVPGHGACVYATDDDIRSLLQQDERYVRFSDATSAPPAVAEQVDRQAETEVD